jgi:hypothetical protein
MKVAAVDWSWAWLSLGAVDTLVTAHAPLVLLRFSVARAGGAQRAPRQRAEREARPREQIRPKIYRAATSALLIIFSLASPLRR